MPSISESGRASNAAFLHLNSSIGAVGPVVTSKSTTSSMTLIFGEATRWEVDSVANPTVFPHSQSSVADIEHSVQLALEGPISFPSLDQALVPGDKLAFAVDPSLPAIHAVVSSVVAWFAARGVSTSNMLAVVGDNQASFAQWLQNELAKDNATAISVEPHDPDTPQGIAYVAANEASDPIYLNRSIVDADVVIPISCARARASLDYFGAFSIFPLLSNRETRGRFYSLPKLDQPAEHLEMRKWADQAAWWLGLLVGIQVVPAPHARVAAIQAGQTEPLEAAIQEHMASCWVCPVRPSELVIALLDGSTPQQAWLHFARALHTANKCTSPGGSIVICSSLGGSVGAGLQRLRQTHRSPAAVAKQLAKDNYDDALAAATVLQAIRDHHVYLVSDIKKSSVESLGVGVIENAEQLSRLVGQHASCTILNSAQNCCTT